MSESTFSWIFFNIFVVIMLLVDLLIFSRKNRQVTLKEAVYWSVFWICLAFLFNIYIYYSRGYDDAINFLSGYLIEKSLSVDNLFVFLLIFSYFKTPPANQHKVLFSGILGAIIMRGLFIWLGIILLSKFHWMIYFFGALLIVSGVKLGLEKGKEIHPENNPLIKLFRKFFPVTENYEGDRFFVRKQGRLFATPLAIVLLTIEITDIIFAVDSIPAILAITYDPFIVYTSNIFAIFGLRSLYFVLSKMMTLFAHLHYGLAVILVFVGVKMLLSGIVHIPSFIALMVIFMVLAVSIATSIVAGRTR